MRLRVGCQCSEDSILGSNLFLFSITSRWFCGRYILCWALAGCASAPVVLVDNVAGRTHHSVARRIYYDSYYRIYIKSQKGKLSSSLAKLYRLWRVQFAVFCPLVWFPNHTVSLLSEYSSNALTTAYCHITCLVFLNKITEKWAYEFGDWPGNEGGYRWLTNPPKGAFSWFKFN
jgi:hypothetical protein